MNKLKWCVKQRRGIKLIEPNNDLAIAYIKKAENSLRAAATLKDNLDWEISASYYTLYFSFYAILMKVGVKSEIHKCTLTLMEEVFNNYFSNDDLLLFKRSQKARVDLQYYSDRNLTEDTLKKIRKNRAVFLVKCKNILLIVKCKNILLNLNKEIIKKIRRGVKDKIKQE